HGGEVHIQTSVVSAFVQCLDREWIAAFQHQTQQRFTSFGHPHSRLMKAFRRFFKSNHSHAQRLPFRTQPTDTRILLASSLPMTCSCVPIFKRSGPLNGARLSSLTG